MKDEEIEHFFQQDESDNDNSSDESDVGSDDSLVDSNYLLPKVNSCEMMRDAMAYSLDLADLQTSAIVANITTQLQPSPSCKYTASPLMNEIRNDMPGLKNIVWKKKNLQVHEKDLVFHSNDTPENLKSLKTPYDCFKYFITDDFLKATADQMNLYARQEDISTKFKTDEVELRKFLGILFFMSVYRYPNCREYWGKYALEPIRLAMTCNRFEEIRSQLHFNDNSQYIKKGSPGFDPLYKVRPIIDHFNQRFGSVPMLQYLCVDEQMCATKMKTNPIRQYMPAKPHKWGSKLFVLCDSSGFSYAFEIYCGAGDNKILADCPNLGAASNVVVRLSKKIPNNANHILYFDNFYTSIGLLLYLKIRGIYSLGTVRPNRVPNIKLSSDAVLNAKKVERGYSEEYVASIFGTDISSVLWFDTRTVRLLSTYVGIEQLIRDEEMPHPSTINRWDRKEKRNVQVNCPAIIREYNKNMGGVDLMDGLIGRYRIRMKTKKWTNRIFFHLLDVAMVNAYILYNRLHNETNSIELPVFRTEIAETLCLLRSTQNVKRGRPLSETPPPKPKKQYQPCDDIRFDQTGHWCKFLDRSGKKMCKNPGCKAETQAFCTKCNLNLCSSTTKQCFIDFHNKK